MPLSSLPTAAFRIGPESPFWAVTSYFNPVGCVPGRALHLWHGELGRRAYASRYRVLAAHGFDAEVDLRLGSQGAWQWATDKPKLHRAVAEYFRARGEDGRESAYAAARRDVEASELAAGGG